MVSRRKMLVHTLVVASLSSGCGAFSSKKSGKKLEENDQQLAGEWLGKCLKKDWFGFSYQQQKLNFSSIGDFDRATMIYSDQACKDAVGTLEEHGTYAVLGDSPAASGARDINMTITSATVKPQNNKATDEYNNKKYCGIDNWQLDQSQDVLGKACDGVSHPNGEVIFDIYRLEDENKGLKTGKSSILFGGNDAASRPTKLNEDQVYTRK